MEHISNEEKAKEIAQSVSFFWAVMQEDIIPERCTIGGLYSKMTISKKKS